MKLQSAIGPVYFRCGETGHRNTAFSFVVPSAARDLLLFFRYVMKGDKQILRYAQDDNCCKPLPGYNSHRPATIRTTASARA